MCCVLLFVFLTVATRIHVSEALWYITQNMSGPLIGGEWYAPM
jgi:hypothetical protein